jgi:hypothetical protein
MDSIHIILADSEETVFEKTNDNWSNRGDIVNEARFIREDVAKENRLRRDEIAENAVRVRENMRMRQFGFCTNILK